MSGVSSATSLCMLSMSYVLGMENQYKLIEGLFGFGFWWISMLGRVGLTDRRCASQREGICQCRALGRRK
jgi:hypothetical protein